MAEVTGDDSKAGQGWDWERWLWACVLVGVGLRVAQWWAGHAIWHDEWMLLWNVEHKTVHELLRGMEMNQGAPPAFLAALRGLYVWCGESRLALRLPSLAAGCVMLAVFALVARRMVGGAGAVVAVATAALSDRMIWHSTEIKPYSIDALVAVCLAWAAMSLKGNRRWVAIAGIGAAGLWASYTTAFMLAGIMGALLPEAWKERRGWMKWTACGAAAGASFVLVYWLVARHQRTAGLAAAWEEDYVPWGKAWMAPFWLVRKTLELCGHSADNVGPIVMGLAAIGAWAWWRSNRTALAVVLGPLGVVLLASALAAYPYGGSRATLFLIPGVFLLMGAGVEAMRGWSGKKSIRRWWWVPGSAVVAALLLPAAYYVAVPRVRTPEIETLVNYVEGHRREGDGIYVASHDGWPAEFVSYWGTRGREVWPRGKEGMPACERLWVVGTHRGKGEFDGWLREIDPAGHGMEERERFEIKRGAAVLFEQLRTAGN